VGSLDTENKLATIPLPQGGIGHSAQGTRWPLAINLESWYHFSNVLLSPVDVYISIIIIFDLISHTCIGAWLLWWNHVLVTWACLFRVQEFQTASMFCVSIASTPCITLCYLKRLACMIAWVMMLNLIVIHCIWSGASFLEKILGLLSALLAWGLCLEGMTPTNGVSMVQSWSRRWLMAWCYAAESVAWNFTENRSILLGQPQCAYKGSIRYLLLLQKVH
jgi:hypothetical protein